MGKKKRMHKTKARSKGSKKRRAEKDDGSLDDKAAMDQEVLVKSRAEKEDQAVIAEEEESNVFLDFRASKARPLAAASRDAQPARTSNTLHIDEKKKSGEEEAAGVDGGDVDFHAEAMVQEVLDDL